MNLVCTFLLITSTVVYTQNLIGRICQIERSEKQGICKPIGECPYALKIKLRGSENYPKCGFQNKITLACCPDENQRTYVTPNRPKRVSELKCSEYQSEVYYKDNSASLRSGSQTETRNGCGIKDALIIGGEDANPKEFPHMALIGVYGGSDQRTNWICGGSLISDRFVLTAAHCIVKDNPNIVRLGELDYDRTDEEASPKEYGIMERTKHPGYNWRISQHHDIALLKLNSIVQFNKYRRPACLPSTSKITEKIAVASGWGYTQALNYNSKSSKLLKVGLNVFNQNECVAIYAEERTIRDNQLCAGSKTEQKDACQADSGGPLQVKHEDEYCMYRIIGITAAGTSCGAYMPGIYIRVYPYLDWIEQIVWRT